jgi:hypothetical protein
MKTVKNTTIDYESSSGGAPEPGFKLYYNISVFLLLLQDVFFTDIFKGLKAKRVKINCI